MSGYADRGDYIDMTRFLKLFAIGYPVYLVIDLLWIGVIGIGFYKEHIGFLLTDEFGWAPAILFYTMLVVGAVIFAVIPGLDAASCGQTAARAAFLGTLTYGTYDLTNQATIEGWPLIVTVVDMLWGAFVVTFISLVMYAGGRKLKL